MPRPEADCSLKHFNTLAFDVRARWLLPVRDAAAIPEALAWAADRALPVHMLGGGSNLVLAADLPGLCLRMENRGIDLLHEDSDGVLVRAAAGENWHGFVRHCLARGWHGLENLALIPGTVGAAPIQNIGAYGVEVAEFIDSIEVYDRAVARFRDLSGSECGFGYRDSRFKREWKERFIITAVRFRLARKFSPQLSYGGLAARLAGEEATPERLFDAVVALRRAKLPDPAELPNAGSFFKNPVVTPAQAEALREGWPGLVSFPDPGGVKLAAGWLIERAGWKGYRQGPVGVHSRQALVLVHFGGGRAADLLSLAERIAADIEQRFGIRLEMEPQILP